MFEAKHFFHFAFLEAPTTTALRLMRPFIMLSCIAHGLSR